MAATTQLSSAPDRLASSRRRSQRLSTGKTSTYFEDDVSDSVEEQEPPRKVAKTKRGSAGKKASPNRDGHAKKQRGDSAGRKRAVANSTDDEDFLEGSEDEAEDQDDYDDDESDESSSNAARTASKQSPKIKKRGRPGAGKAQVKAPVKAGRVDRGEGEDEDEDEDDEESRVTFIPLPKLRDTGGIDYEPERIHPNTLLFLKDLKANNKRSWLKLHDEEYRRSLKDWESFVESITEKITEADETVPELPLKDVIFRIYRDVRFSKDPTPYKPHYSAAWSRTGRKGPYACYYIHVEPQKCFIGGGLWCPDKDALARLRASVDERPHRIRRILMDPAFRDNFLAEAAKYESLQNKKNKKGGKSNATRDEVEIDEAAAVIRAFAEANKESALKTRPKGVDPEHRDIELLKLKNYTVGKKFSDHDFTAPDAQERIMESIRALVGFVTFLNSVVMPDPGDDSDSEDDE
ncbi:uncharacterized protein B0I36DRAFT_367426 [Microdochium trichocladiopsis]|uniref:DUF2461 domain-containing protein n=1 Tax=Microdochium trichocladiopsis TaxID=1682393 RepID=A0A9P8XV09_9PEZI|nr:uncharacterized protein B0I36DRAFT_367426 [Microdochium trichocladiopsis]KAH7020956.1 hypothetical protein B0I36DRAFT_367426 [Microdochium trichocladiopsis]